ncbi:MAG: DMT family transporter [Planctomycetales bacterium]|nr:DMT family transporter [Planctomycetales bacterium]
MLLGAAAFGTMGALAHAAGERQIEWQLIAAARAIIPLALAGAMAMWSGVRLVFWRPWTLWQRSLAGSCSLVCTFYSLTQLPVADVLTLTNLYPVWVGLLSWPLLGHPPTRDIWFATVVGIVGVVLIQQPHLADGNMATMFAVIASFSSGVAMIGLHQLHAIDPRAIVFHFSAVALMFCLVALFGFGHRPDTSHLFEPASVALLLGVGASATFGQFFLTLAFLEGHPAKVSVVGLSQVGFGIAFDVLIWHRSFQLLTLAGIALVLAPTAWLLVRRGEVQPEIELGAD